MRCLFPLLLVSALLLSGCQPEEDTRLYIYCTETFWYVLQEEANVFNRTHDFQIVLIPLRAERNSGNTANVGNAAGILEIGTGRHAPIPWQIMPIKEDDEEETEVVPVAPSTQVHPDIVRQIERISNEHFGDMFLSDSLSHLNKVRNTALSANDFPICYLTLTMLVSLGNPHHVHSVKEVLDTGRRLGMMNPSFDGLGEASWKVLERILPDGVSAIPGERIQLYERQYDLLEALEQGNIDAALVWSAASQTTFLVVKYAHQYFAAHEEAIRRAERRDDQKRRQSIIQAVYREIHGDIAEKLRFAEEVPLTANPDERQVVAIRLVALSSTSHHGRCQRFADFMRSHQGKAVLRRHGFAAE